MCLAPFCTTDQQTHSDTTWANQQCFCSPYSYNLSTNSPKLHRHYKTSLKTAIFIATDLQVCLHYFAKSDPLCLFSNLSFTAKQSEQKLISNDNCWLNQRSSTARLFCNRPMEISISALLSDFSLTLSKCLSVAQLAVCTVCTEAVRHSFAAALNRLHIISVLLV